MAGKNHLIIHDRLSRFIRHKNLVSPTSGRVKPNAFMPAPDQNLSVFHTEGIAGKQVWQLADKYLKVEKGIEFRGDIQAAAFLDNQLTIDADYTPERHINITGWPEEKQKQKMIALKLAIRAILVMRRNEKI